MFYIQKRFWWTKDADREPQLFLTNRAWTNDLRFAKRFPSREAAEQHARQYLSSLWTVRQES